MDGFFGIDLGAFKLSLEHTLLRNMLKNSPGANPVDVDRVTRCMRVFERHGISVEEAFAIINEIAKELGHD